VNIGSLLPLATPDRTGLTQDMATASAATRITLALFCLPLPILGFVLGILPKRSRSALGRGIGILLILLFWQACGFIEDRFVGAAPVLQAIILVCVAAVAYALYRVQNCNQPGIAEATLVRMVVLTSKRISAVYRRIGARSPFIAPWGDHRLRAYDFPRPVDRLN
jgi:hypothetical protein